MRLENVRIKGLTKLLIGAAGFAAAFWYVMKYGVDPVGGARTSHYRAIGAGAVGALAIVGLLELCTGVSFKQFAARWDSLEAWQRGVFGTFILLLALATVSGIFLGLAYFRII